MKWIHLLICSCLLDGAAHGKSFSSGEMSICNFVSRQIELEFLDLGKRIPSSWEELPGIQAIREGRLEESIKGLNIYNEFAIVPGTPKITESHGIPKQYVGMHLYMIQRDPDPSKLYSYTGRATILIGPETPDPKNRRIMSMFLDEKIASVMIAQIEGFDPHNQPVAFEKEFISEIVSQKEEVQREIKEHISPEQLPRSKKRLKSETDFKITNNSTSGILTTSRVVLFFGATLGLVLGCFLWRRMRFGS